MKFNRYLCSSYSYLLYMQLHYKECLHENIALENNEIKTRKRVDCRNYILKCNLQQYTALITDMACQIYKLFGRCSNTTFLKCTI
ncbi:unnamed protein product [Colias eurytheme]|nr:unnamed protein product [Colias eurytheme]